MKIKTTKQLIKILDTLAEISVIELDDGKDDFTDKEYRNLISFITDIQNNIGEIQNDEECVLLRKYFKFQG